MADQQSTHASLSPAVGTYYSKKHLKDFDSRTVWYSSAPVREDAPKGGGNTVQFTRYRKIAGLFANNTDQFTAQQMYGSAQTLDAVLVERDGYMQVSRFADLTCRNNMLDQFSRKMQDAATKTLDLLIRNSIGCVVADKAVYSANMFDNLAIDGGTLNSSGITARIWTRRADGFPIYHNKTRLAQSSTVVSIAASAMTVKTIQHGVNVLTGKDVPELGDGNYKLITHPFASYGITTQAGFKGWFSPTTTSPVKRKASEVGVIAGVAIENTTLAYRFPLSGDTLSTSSGNLYLSLLYGQEAFGSVTLNSFGGSRGYKFHMKESGSQTTSDPTNMKKQVGFSITNVGRVINKSAGLWIATSSTD